MSVKLEDFDKLIDRTLLISLIQQRPVLWDKHQECYKDKVAKTAAWREICSIINEKFEGMKKNKQTLFEKSVILRWTRIRDAWVKTLNSMRAVKISGSSTYVRPYKYDKELNFLKRVIDFRDGHDKSNRNRNIDRYITLGNSKCEQIEINRNVSDDEIEDDVAENNQNNQKTTGNLTGTCINPPIRKRKYARTVDEHISDELVDESRHLAFFKSVLPSLRAFDDDQTLEFQSGVIKLIQTVKRRPRCDDWSQNYLPSYLSTTGRAQSLSEASTASQSPNPDFIQVDLNMKSESVSN